MVATRGPGLAATEMPVEPLADINRGRLRGWASIGAILLVVLGVLSWPYLLGVAVFLVAAAVCFGLAIWVHTTLTDVGKEPSEEGKSDTGGSD
ncbi:MAG: hypothetical protein WB788_07275 [Thermoplasmata archaeon]